MRLASAFLLGLVVLAALSPHEAKAKAADPAERGLDVFVHAPSNVVSGGTFTLDVRGYGFPSVASAEPLPGASIVAAWDPESLGGGVSKVPADALVQTDRLGEARLEVPVPEGGPRPLSLFVEIRHGEHSRIRRVEVARLSPTYLELRLAETRVVPGSRIPAWVAVSDARTGRAISGAGVEVVLLEGDVDRATEHVTTDASGLARATFAIPAGTTGLPALSLRARLPDTGVHASVVLGLREETPGTPRFFVKWQELQLKPSEIGHAEMRLVDATDEPIAGHPVVYWTGPKGTTPPQTDDEWKKNGIATTTDGLGSVQVQTPAPRVVKSLGSELTIVARTEVEGQKLEGKQTVAVGQAVATASVSMEGGAIVPGVAQRAYLHVSDGDHGVAGDFAVEGDGLRARVTTDAFGDAELTWTVPEDIGAKREVGPCAGGVAAALVVRQAKPIATLARHPEPFELCVTVARDVARVLRTSVQVARIGDRVRATSVLSKRAAHGGGSIVVTSPEGHGQTLWTLPDAPGEAEIDLAKMTPGLHTITLAVPRRAAEAETSATQLLVVPRVLPKVTAKLASAKLAPGKEAELDVVLDDGHGAPITGTVTGVVIDKEGGGSVTELERLDARATLCAQAGVPRDRCDGFLEGDASTETSRRALLTTGEPHPQAPVLDPAAHAAAELKKTFSDVLHSLEGAVYQAETPESLRDVRRKEKGAWTFNPELMTLVTAAMNEPPTTPGGEPFGLKDLLAVDPQVTFDSVARRVTRLKLFNVLSAVRVFRHGEQLDVDEPVLRDPNALLRRFVREGRLTAEGLLDPWGGTIQFVPTNGPTVPFLTPTRGFALHAPGPDGRVGTADDVSDPFERVVRGGTPYADAMGEDEIVDAKWDMRVGDATVSGWQELLSRFTGTGLGHGSGTGSGEGFGNGHGRLGGSHSTKAPTLRSGKAITTDSARWTDPIRTDAQGRVKLKVPLGDHETTWRIALLARTDAGQTAVSTIDATTFLPVSAHVDLGRKLTIGDSVGARVIVRNRTAVPRTVKLDVAAEGALALATRGPRTFSVDVPPSTVRSVIAWFDAKTVGQGKAVVTLSAPGTEGDRATEEIAIEEPGEPRVLGTVWTSARDGSGTERARLGLAVPPGYTLRDRARLVLESGVEDALLAALGSLDPHPGMPPDSLADAIEIASRIEAHAESQGKRWLVARSRKLATFARAYLDEQERTAERVANLRLALDRARLFVRVEGGGTFAPPKSASRTSKDKDDRDTSCPKDDEVSATSAAAFLDAEPVPTSSGPLPCFTALADKVDTKAPLEVARASLALFERPHRTPAASTLAKELARMTRADTPAGPAFDGTRATRAIVLAALVRSAYVWSKEPSGTARRLVDAMASLRDARGGYGSSEATRDAVRAMLSLEQSPARPARVTVTSGKNRRTFDLAPNTALTVDLETDTRHVELETSGGPLVARLERPVLRTFSAPPATSITPVTASVDWPNDAKVGATGVVHVTYKSSLGRNASVWTKLPLPPGVSLAAPVKNVVQRQGVLHIRAAVGAIDTISLPVRFTLAGKVLVPEAETQTTSEEQPRYLTPARSLNVRAE